MLRYVIRRLLAMIPLMIIITSICFLLGQYAAGDLAMYLTQQATPVGEEIDMDVYYRYREELGLDDPVLVRYGRWLSNALQGDLGRSYVTMGQPKITYLIQRSLPVSLQLGFAALVVVTSLGIPMGVLAAVYQNRPLDYLIVGGATILSSIPGYVLAPVAMVFLVVRWSVLPSVGLGWHGLLSEKTILPVLVLAVGRLLPVVRYTRSSVLEVLSEEYVRAARAKGLPELMVVLRHVIKNELMTVTTVLGLITAGLISGSIFIEVIFNLPGLGGLAAQSFRRGDLQTATGILLVTGLIVMMTNLVVDLGYGLLDPRVQSTD